MRLSKDLQYKTKYLLAKKQLQHGGMKQETYGVLKNNEFTFHDSITLITSNIVLKLDNSNITTFIFPAMLETIGNNAFLGCNQATFDFSNADKLKSIGDGAFRDCRAIKKLNSQKC